MRIRAHGPPHGNLFGIKLELRRHDADDGIQLPVEAERLAGYGRVRAELCLPERMAQHHHAISQLVPGLECAAKDGTGAQYQKEVGSYLDRKHFARRTAAAQDGIRIDPAICGELLHGSAAAAPGQKIAIGIPDACRIQLLRFALPDGDQAPRILERKRAKEHRIEMLKTAVFAPMPSARVKITRAAKRGLRSAVRNAYARSSRSRSKLLAGHWFRHASLICPTPPNSSRACRRASAGSMPPGDVIA